MEEVVFYRVRAKVQLASNLAVGITFGQPADHVLLPFGKQIRTLSVYEPGRRRLRQSFQQELKLDNADPELPPVYPVNAPSEHLERVLTAKNASCPTPKCFYHQIALGSIKQHHHPSGGVRYSQLSEYLKAFAWLALKLFAD